MVRTALPIERLRWTRRRLVGAGSSGILVTTTASGCDLFSTDPAENPGSDSEESQAREAPVLARRVDEGDLPPLGERLPERPLVVEPVDTTGAYGGTLQTTTLGPSDYLWIAYIIGYEGLVRWVPNWKGSAGTKDIIPNVAEEFRLSDDGRECVFVLRRGLRWSDGEPFTADDVVFAQNDVLNNVELFPDQPSNQPVAEKLDDHTVAFQFPEPSGLFLHDQSSLTGADLVNKPFHYLKDFHPEYNPNVGDLVAEAEAEDWVSLFDRESGAVDSAMYWQKAGIPTLNPWMITTPLGDGGAAVAERNPYYWKTDPDGRQLPYIDRVNFDVMSDAETMLTRAINGDIDLMVRHFNTLANKPVLARNRDDGDYAFFEAIRSTANDMYITPNYNHPDEALRAVFHNRDFRIGLSHAINRSEIIDVVYQRQGEPWQQAPNRVSSLFDEELATQYLEYDVDLANEYLDRAGLTDRDEDGTRLGPNGEPVSFGVEVSNDLDPVWPDVMELVRGYWREVGIDARLNVVGRDLQGNRTAANEHDAAVWRGNGGVDIFTNPFDYFPGNFNSAPLWTEWYYSDGEDGEEPPESVQRQFALYDELSASVDGQQQENLMRELLGISRENFWVIGTTLNMESYGIVKNTLRNVPGSMPYSSTYPTPGPTNPEQYFLHDG